MAKNPVSDKHFISFYIIPFSFILFSVIHAYMTVFYILNLKFVWVRLGLDEPPKRNRPLTKEELQAQKAKEFLQEQAEIEEKRRLANSKRYNMTTNNFAKNRVAPTANEVTASMRGWNM